MVSEFNAMRICALMKDMAASILCPPWGFPIGVCTTERFPDLGFFVFLDNVDLGILPVGFGAWEGVQSIETSSGIQIDGFSARTEPPGSIFNDFRDLCV